MDRDGLGQKDLDKLVALAERLAKLQVHEDQGTIEIVADALMEHAQVVKVDDVPGLVVDGPIHTADGKVFAAPAEVNEAATPNPMTTIAELARMNLNLLTKLVPWLDANEKRQRKFVNAVLIRLSKIETLVTMIHGAQSAEAHLRNPRNKKNLSKNAEDTEAYVSEKSDGLGIAMVKYIYGESREPSQRHDRKRKWSG